MLSKTRTFNMHIASGGIGVGLSAVVTGHRHFHRLDYQLMLLSVTQNLGTVRDNRKQNG